MHNPGWKPAYHRFGCGITAQFHEGGLSSPDLIPLDKLPFLGKNSPSRGPRESPHPEIDFGSLVSNRLSERLR